MRIRGFEPFYNENAKILILGSFPSVKSRENMFYYGNPRNAFWRVLAKAFCQPLPDGVEEKKAFLLKNKIALWDVVSECEIVGSLDSNIKNYVASDIKTLVTKIQIEKIILNGGKAFEIFKKINPELLNVAVQLPSTSPANFRFDEQVWLEELKKV